MESDTSRLLILCGISFWLTSGEALRQCYGSYTDRWGQTITKYYSCLSTQRCCGTSCCSSTSYVSTYAVYRMWYFWFCLAGGVVILMLLLGSYIRVRNRTRARVTNMGMAGRVRGRGQPSTIVISQQQQQQQPRPMMAGYPMGHQPAPMTMMNPPPPYTLHAMYPPGSAPLAQPPPPPPPPPQPFAYGAQQATPHVAPPPAAAPEGSDATNGSDTNAGNSTIAGQGQDGAAARPMAPAYGTNFSKY